MIANLLAWLRFKITPPIEFRFEFNSVRMSEDMPDFKATMWIDKFGRCSSRGPILKLEGAQLQSWNLTKTKDNSTNLYFTIAGRRFDVSDEDEHMVFNYFMNELPHLWKSDHID